MNIAFATVLILLILSPGFVFNTSFYSGAFSRKHIKTTFFDQIPWSIIPGIIINLIWYFGVEHFTNYKISLKTIGLLVVGPKSNECISQCFQNIEAQILPISGYFVTIWIFSFFIGHISRVFIRKRKLDRKYKPLRIANYWHYFLSGEYLDFPDFEPDGDGEEKIAKFGYDDLDVVITYVKVMSDLDNHELIYYGMVVHFELDSEGDLKSIFLKNSMKKDVFHIKNSRHQIKALENEEEVAGVLMVPFKSIVDIKLGYYQVEKEVDTSESDAEDAVAE